MESNNQEQLKEEIPNIEQFQVDRSPSPEEETQQNVGGGGANMQDAYSDVGYTDQEVPFADGEGTPLNDELLGPEDDEDEDEDDIVVDDPDDDEINVDDPDEEDLV